MRKTFSILAIVFSCAFVQAQNLVPNPSFEDTIYCPQVGEMNALVNWNSYSASPDYFNSCAGFQFGVPNNSFGYQQPVSTSSGYSGLYSYYDWLDTNYREMVGVKLNDTLIIGQKYYISLKVSLANQSNCASNNLGILFSTIPFIDTTMVGSTWTIKNYAHLYSYAIIMDTLNWTTISGTVIADSTYQYLSIGNFFSNSNTNIILYNGNNCFSYYFIDDVCISLDSATCGSINSIGDLFTENLFTIYPNPSRYKFSIQLCASAQNSIVEVYNTYGILLYQYAINGNNINIDSENYLPGIYFLKIKSNSNNTYINKLLITN